MPIDFSQFKMQLLILNKLTIQIKKTVQLSENGRLPEHIDLSPYDESAVKTLVGYIHNHNQDNIKISFYGLADLLDLSRSLLMPGLLKQLEDVSFQQKLTHTLFLWRSNKSCLELFSETALPFPALPRQYLTTSF